MPAVTEILRDAQILADFSNLETAGVEYFRRNHPDFLPQAWWDYEPMSSGVEKGNYRPTGSSPEKQWQMNQRFLRDTWDRHFPQSVFFITRLLLSVFDPKQMFNVVWGDVFKGEDRPAFATLSELEYQAYPYQKAVSFLFDHPWRAKFCAQCYKRFVAVERNNKYCSEACSHEAHIGQKLKYWHKKGGGGERRAAQLKERNESE